MADNYFGNYGVESGYNQSAPGRDMEEPRAVGRPGRPRRGPQVVPSATGTPEQPLPEVTPFAGAQQTIGAPSRSGRENQLNQNVIGDVQRAVQPFQAPSLAPGAPAPGSMADPMAAAPAAPRTSTTTLMEGDARKLGDPNHWAKSPKYQYLSRATQYGRGQEGELLDSLKKDYGSHWNGWEFDGRGNFVYKGDPSQLHGDWKGATRVDAYEGYNAGGDLRARWGVDEGEGGGAAPAGVPAGFVPPQQFLDPTVMQNAIMQSGVPQGQDYSTRIQQQILAALRGRL